MDRKHDGSDLCRLVSDDLGNSRRSFSPKFGLLQAGKFDQTKALNQAGYVATDIMKVM
jgi:hypothetical protein